MTDAGAGYTIEQFMVEARATIDAEGLTETTLRALGERLRRLSETQQLLADSELAAMHNTESRATVLHSEGPEGLTLMLAKFTDREPTPIHDHGSWAVACVMRGRDHYYQWERLDDGADQEHSQLRVVSERELGPGDIVYWLNPPHDIHSQQGIGGPVWELLLFGRNTAILPRHYFDRETGEVRMALPL